MPNKYILLSVVALGGLFPTHALLAQDAAGDQAPSEAPRIFFDCQGPQASRKSLVSERDPDVSGRPHQVAVGRDQLELGDGFFQGYREDLRRTQGHHAP